MEFTHSQKKALSTERHLAITANAGSGKTRVLVERYINLFERYADLATRNVAAITFTENAASELRERVLREISERLKDSAILSDRNRRERLRKLRDSLPSAFIGTIHGFATRILRAYPVEANVDAGFAITTGADQRILAEDAISRVFYSALEEAYENINDSNTLRLFRKLGRHEVTELVRALLRNRARAERIRKHLLAKNTDEVLAFWRGHIEQALSICGDPSVKELVWEVKRCLKKGKTVQDFLLLIQGYEVATEFFETAKTFTAVVNKLLTKNGTLRANLIDFSTAPIGMQSEVDELISKILPLRDLLNACPESEEVYKTDHLEYLALLRTVFDLYDHVLLEYTSTKTEYGLLDFDDLIEKLHRLFEDRRVLDELSREFRFLMIDEYQDTDESQFELVQLLTENFGARSNLAIVGDPKQAIYTFRNADAGIFHQTKESIRAQSLSATSFEESLALSLLPEEELGWIALGETFRMTRLPLAAINRLFRSVMGQRDATNTTGYSDLIHGRIESLPGNVEWICPLATNHTKHSENGVDDETNSETNSEENGEDIESASEASLIARKIRGIRASPEYQVEMKDGLRRVAYEDIAILLRSRTNLAMLERALRAENIPYSVAKGAGFFVQPEILDITGYLAFLTAPSNDVALAAILRAPFFAISDAQLFQIAYHESANRRRLIDPWNFWDQFQSFAETHKAPYLMRAVSQIRENLALAGRTATAMLVEKIYAETGIFATLQVGPQAAQKIANLEKFLALARASDASGFSGLLDFVERIKYLTDSEEQESQADVPDGRGAVRIMTVHAAKGLEFPIVILPFLQKPFQFDYSHLLDKELGLQIKSPDREQTPIIAELIRDRARVATIAEEQRIFYVAATRARDHLIFSCTMPEKPKHNSWLAWASDAFGLLPDSEALHFVETIERYNGELGISKSESIVLDIPLIRHAADITITEDLVPLETAMERGPIYLDELRIPRPTARFSATQLLRHKECPTKYYLACVLGMPEEPKLAYDLEPDEYSERIHGQLLGQIIHQLLEKIDQFAPGGAFDRSRAERELNKIFDTIGVPEYSDRFNYSATIFEHVTAFLKSRFSTAVFAGTEIQTEFSLQTSLESGDTLFGIIDRLFRDEHGTWTVLDYKTGTTSDVDRHLKNIERYQFQLQFYAYLVHLFDPSAETIRGVLFFTSTGEVKEFTFGSSDFESFANECSAIIQQIRRDEEVPELRLLHRNLQHCHECSFYNWDQSQCVVLTAGQNPMAIPAR
ncbi:MAG TPA: UvrD-helicase domain-containing protein [Candidatus Kapabacteria bacterium]|nr:UvrD-helicase domain-containing protein [Candidatus Kapabacteria bacterium]